MEGRKVKEKKVARDVAINPRVVASPRQVLELLTCVSSIGSYAGARGQAPRRVLRDHLLRGL
jgi:hypothetical protein